MSDMSTSDESECAVDLSLPKSIVLKSPSPTKTSQRKNILGAGTSNSGDEDEYFGADAYEPKSVMPEKRSNVLQQIQTEEKQITQTIEIVTKQTEAVEQLIAALPTEQLPKRSGATDKKSREPELAAPSKPTVEPARETRKKPSQKASTSQPSISQASTLQLSTSQASTLQPSTSQASTSQPSTSKASTSQLSTSKPSTSRRSTSKASTSQPSTSKASTSKASESQACKTQKSRSKASKSQTSTSKASKSQESTSKTTSKASSTPHSSAVRKEEDSNLPSGKKPSASTSVPSSSSTTTTDSHFWIETIKSKFRSGAYRNRLIESNFSEEQAEELQNLFHHAARRMHNTFINSDRVMKMHQCRECVFSICHQCVSLSFLHPGMTSGDPTTATLIAPRTTIICICRLAFFHDHTNRSSRSETVKTGNLHRITSLRCAVCDTLVMIEHPQDDDSECKFTKWSGINSSIENTFYAQLVDYVKDITTETVSLDELYTCNHHCCLLFHRCTQ
ncbi:N gene-c9.1 [Ichnoviriform fugitivi]|uniref:N gene-c9.1 n=1 Tax=Ichnoviriform fugitivi TaxID=265522 RepID=A2Q0H3_9VIRU|nr:N gene-c9.1 [Ichnoviriform fugitivi]BAF45688.1 N gene-c9.1 [Ichnoviriform fugitivi]